MGGKTFTSIILGCKLKTYTLFIASQIDHLQSFELECKQHIPNSYKIIDGKWDGTLAPFMLVTTQLLSQRPAFITRLKEYVGLLIADEIHKAVTAENTRNKVLYQFKSKYKVFLSATHEHRYDGFAEKALSGNIIHVKVPQEPISLIPIELNIGALEHASRKNFSVYKSAIYDQMVPELVKTVEWIVSKDRQVLIHNDSFKHQNLIKQELSELGIRCEVLNQAATKKEREQMKAAYEKGEVKVIVGGTALEASLSLYKASVGIWTTLASSENSAVQFYGRLKRFKKEVCDKSKMYIDLIYSGETAYFRGRMSGYKKEHNLVLKKMKRSGNFEFLSLLKK